MSRRDGHNGAVGARIGESLRGKSGRTFWRSLDELAGTEDFRRFLEAEFPSIAPDAGSVNRRALLNIMGASLAMAGLAGCGGETDEEALPYVVAPENVIPGNPKWYATSVTFGGYAQPVLGKTHTGRPVKLEGNPDHPAAKGATDAFTQAALIGLYDPDRTKAPLHLGRATTWSTFDAAIREQAEKLDGTKGQGLRLLTGAVSSPTLQRQIGDLLRRWPNARWHAFEPAQETTRRDASRQVFGEPLDWHLRLDKAAVIVALDDDLLGPGPRQVHHGRMWSERRQAFHNGKAACTLLVAEPTPSLTGTMATERLVVPHARIAILLAAFAQALGLQSGVQAPLDEAAKAFAEHALERCRRNPGAALISVGAQHAAELQALALLVNERLGALGNTLGFTDPVIAEPPDGSASLEALVSDMSRGQVGTLLILDCNPAYTAPVDLDFADVIERVPLRLHAGLHHDETAALCHWHLPLQHDLEAWTDARAVDGTVGIIQPLVRPFYDVRSKHVLLENIAGRFDATDRDLVQATWRTAWGQDFDARWRDTLYRGFIPDSVLPEKAPTFNTNPITLPQPPKADGLTVLFRPDPTIWDGRFANNAWLQELPKPIGKIVWGNAVFIAPALAGKLEVENGNEVRVSQDGAAVTGPVWIVPGQEPDTIVLTLGYGRRISGEDIGGGLLHELGYDATPLRRAAGPWALAGAEIAVTGNHQDIASTQYHSAMDGYDFVRTVSAPDEQAAEKKKQPSFYPNRKWDSPSWGMSVDVDLCIGCNACVVACMAENNIPVVGKELVAMGREMHWLRIDRYHEGDPADPAMYFQPVPCMHCEQAPCEMGCPVNATTHSPDGLNQQIYNRCIGTRTCSSFCPYKVRHFNWFDYTADDPPETQAARNPDVTVRQRGVMEKCTYCVQRIREAQISAQKDGRILVDGDVRTACQQACPTQAISFGDVIDPESAVSRRKASPRDYTLLEEVNTRPRTTYLARITESVPGKAKS